MFLLLIFDPFTLFQGFNSPIDFISYFGTKTLFPLFTSVSIILAIRRKCIICRVRYRVQTNVPWRNSEKTNWIFMMDVNVIFGKPLQHSFRWLLNDKLFLNGLNREEMMLWPYTFAPKELHILQLLAFYVRHVNQVNDDLISRLKFLMSIAGF